MPFTLDHDAANGIATLRFSGTITGEDLMGSSMRCFALQKEAGILRFLIDSDDWDLAASVIDLHALPHREYVKAEVDRRTRIAVVQPTNEKARQGARFYEDACRNRGWNARILPDRDTAIAWLKGR
ncbi:MAG TPA: hypothetical protein VFV90_13300 [Usitatibacter sp.]|jgi:hypothetical protein|nr:hypothetical protein [Usitatibacter sp.]